MNVCVCVCVYIYIHMLNICFKKMNLRTHVNFLFRCVIKAKTSSSSDITTVAFSAHLNPYVNPVAMFRVHMDAVYLKLESES